VIRLEYLLEARELRRTVGSFGEFAGEPTLGKRRGRGAGLGIAWASRDRPELAEAVVCPALLRLEYLLKAQELRRTVGSFGGIRGERGLAVWVRLGKGTARGGFGVRKTEISSKGVARGQKGKCAKGNAFPVEKVP